MTMRFDEERDNVVETERMLAHAITCDVRVARYGGTD